MPVLVGMPEKFVSHDKHRMLGEKCVPRGAVLEASVPT